MTKKLRLETDPTRTEQRSALCRSRRELSNELIPTSIYLQTSASIQPRTSPSKFGEISTQYYSFVSLSGPVRKASARAPGQARLRPAAQASSGSNSGSSARSPGRGLQPGLKGSVGEGPNQTNYSDQSSIRILGIEIKPRKTISPSRILSKFRNFR